MRKDSYNKALEQAYALHNSMSLAERNRLGDSIIARTEDHMDFGSLSGSWARLRLAALRQEWILSTRDGRGCPKPIAMRLRSEGWE